MVASGISAKTTSENTPEEKSPAYTTYAMAGLQFLSAVVQAQAVRDQAKIQKEIDDYNAQLAEYDAWRIKGAGQAAIARYQTQLDQAAGKAKVSAAAAGADIKSGSLSEIVAENQNTGYLNKLDMDNRMHEQAMGYKRQASNIRLNSDLHTMGANVQSNSMILGGALRAGGTAVSGYYAGKNLDVKTPTQQQTQFQVAAPEPPQTKINTPSGYGIGDMNPRPRDGGYKRNWAEESFMMPY